jgi:hypothetical protein
MNQQHASRFRLKPPPRLNENDVERACLDLLRLRGYWVGRNHCGTFKSADGNRWIKGAPKGTPDYVTCHAHFPGFLLEVKRPGEEASPEQKTKIMEIRLGYHLAIAVVDTVEALSAWIRQHEAAIKPAPPTLD